ncbi:MAG: glycosyltransferase family 4 protein [Geodermatophilaceae bacterium]|nr:glycosyltransferase family 4 protein [Geodermatophilaceae bacterium]MDQ3456003.1 glycosyltransferase family 4 protein [Actinomycetota bacterium]
MSSSSDGARVAVVLSGWPRLSEVFALNELTALHEAGMLATALALKNGESGPVHPAAARIGGLVEYVPPGDLAEQATFVADLLIATQATGVHGYFAHDPAAVAAAAAEKVSLPFGFSVHALDARKVRRADLADRVRRAAVVLCCNSDAAAEVAAAGGRAELIPHGVDLTAFPATPPPAAEPLNLLAVGRFVEKKGFDVLLDAFALVNRPVRLRLVGDGALRAELTDQVARLGVTDRVEFADRLTHETLPGAYAAADIVVVPSVIDRRGDRDGLPNVVLEAMASARPVVASAVSAIPSAVHHDRTGLLVPSRDPPALAAALTELIDSPARRRALGLGGRALVTREFELGRCTRRFCATLAAAYA